MKATALLTDLKQIQELAKAQDDENIRFRQFLAYRLPWSDRHLDEVVLQIAHEVSAGIDCTQCANCCKTLEVSLRDADLERLATHLGITIGEVEARYASSGRQCDRAFAHHPCALLHNDRCTVYEARPEDCRAYPHLDTGDFRSRMWQLLPHAENCPIIFNTLQRLKQAVNDDKPVPPIFP